jgi:CRP-like cAMP-binding protein
MPDSTADEYQTRGENRLLQRLPVEVRERLLQDLDPVRLGFKEPVYESDRPIQYVYFPLDSVLSVLTTLEDNAHLEVATVGNEGFVGLPVFLGGVSTPGRAFCQISGEALRMRSRLFREHAHREAVLRDILLRYTQAYLTFVSQSAGCNRAHAVDERLARWLLITHDGIGRDQFPITQEFIGLMLGVSRATVNTSASLLQRAGFIRYQRGRITVADREGLESAACTCYAVIRREFDRLLA